MKDSDYTTSRCPNTPKLLLYLEARLQTSDLWTSVAPFVSSLVEPTYNSAVSQELMLPRQLEPPFRKLTFPLNLTLVTGPNYLAGNGLYLVRLCSDCDT